MLATCPEGTQQHQLLPLLLPAETHVKLSSPRPATNVTDSELEARFRERIVTAQPAPVQEFSFKCTTKRSIIGSLRLV